MKRNIFFLVMIFPLVLSSCRKDFEFTEFDYTSYNRVVGPQGGSIDFYGNYKNDKQNNVIVNFNVPSGALDSMMVFNMYQYENYELATLMEDGFAKFGTKLLYFVPFYESEGYHERGQFERNYHLSVKFKKPITVTYYPMANYSDFSFKNWQEVVLFQNYYKTTNKAYKVYRIKIPKIDEWGTYHNIFVNWSGQGYPNGYDPTDITYIVNGRWSPASAWGTGEISMINWEELVRGEDYELDPINDKVTFKIYDSDYIYVVARDVYLKILPTSINSYVTTNFTGYQVQRASFDDNQYKVYFTNRTVAVFNQWQGFEYLLNENLYFSNLPTGIQADLIKFNDEVIKISFKDYGYTYYTYEVILKSGIHLTYNGLTYERIAEYQFGYDPSRLNPEILADLQTRYPGQTITNVVYSSNYGWAEYIIYLSSNARVYYDGYNQWYQTIYYKVGADKIPPVVIDYFKKNFPNTDFFEINIIISPYGPPVFEISLIGNKWFRIGTDGKTYEIYEYIFRNIPDAEIPQLVKNAIASRFPDKTVYSVWHRFDQEVGELYVVYFTDYTNARFGPDGALWN